MKPVYVFPGQGSQRRGMGEGLFDKFRDLVAQADACLGYSIEELCLRDPSKVLGQTEYTQPALYVVSVLTYLDRMRSGGEPPGFVAGHSLGEYCALHVAGAFDFATGLSLVRKRGELMARAPKGAMAAVVNLDLDRVRDVLARLPYRGIDMANLNARHQCVLSGVYDELTAPAVKEAFTAAGASFIPLNVSAAFHSRCMTGVQDEFGKYLATFTLRRLTIPVIANVTARPYPTTDYIDCLVRQIASPVRWYESMSWLISQGYRVFHETGPGNVLTKLAEKILAEPMAIAAPVPVPVAPAPAPAPRPAVQVAVAPAAPPPAAPAVSAPVVPTAVAPRPANGRTQLIFLYGGQGTQYMNMGRALYDASPAFRAAMDRCSAAFQAASGRSLISAIYGDPARRDLDDLIVSHPALFSIGYSLTEALREAGFEPDGVLGHSLGELIAATVAGAMGFDDALDLVIRHARLVAQRCRGGMLSVLAAPGVFHDRREIFDGTALAGINFAGNFVVSGEDDRLTAAQAALDKLDIIAVRLPVRCGFHSALVDPIRNDFLSAASAIRLSSPRLPIYSSARGRALGPELAAWPAYLWDVVRQPIRFDTVMTQAFAEPGGYYFVDLSASGSFASFLKHGYGARYRSASAINQFGNNAASMERLRGELRAALGQGHRHAVA